MHKSKATLITFLSLIICCILVQCKSPETTERFQKQRNNVIDVSNRIVDIDNGLFFGPSLLSIHDSLLILSELTLHGYDKCIHMLNKNTFEHIVSTGILGKGPQEITRPGDITIEKDKKILWVSDHARRVMWRFPLDSVLSNNSYKPTDYIQLPDVLELITYSFINDSTIIGRSVVPLTHNSFEMATAKLNTKTKHIAEFGYENPNALGRWVSNSSFALSVENNLYVNAHWHLDLLTLIDLEGNLLANIYGPGWGKERYNQIDFFSKVALTSKYIFTTYLGEYGFTYDENNRPRGLSPSKILIFDLKGNYLKTLEVGEEIGYFCVDEENNRIIIYSNARMNSLGYISLEGLV